MGPQQHYDTNLGSPPPVDPSWQGEAYAPPDEGAFGIGSPDAQRDFEEQSWTRPAAYLPASRLGMLPPGYDSSRLETAAPRGAPPAAAGPVGSGRIEHLLLTLVQARGSDLLLSVGTPPQARIDGTLRPMRREPVTADEMNRYVRELLDDTRLHVLQQYRSVDFSFSGIGDGRFRGNVYYSKGDFSVALRHLPGRIPSPESLGLPPVVVGFAHAQQGLVLVTGPTGSGKSTTIASLVQRINESRPCHVVTIEDPIEYLFGHGVAVVDQREIGWDALTFADALRAVLREDPDVVLVGEMRDIDSIASAITVAETGHLVFATLHTNDAPQAIDRVIDVFPGDQQRQIRAQLSQALLGVVHQRLYPRQAGGRVAAFEVLMANDPIRNMIREGKTNQMRNVMQQSAAEGMMTLEACLGELHKAGILP